MLRLLLLNDGGLSGGGAETRVLQLLDHWHRAGFLESATVLHHHSCRTPQPQRPYLAYRPSPGGRDGARLVAELLRTGAYTHGQAHNLLLSGARALSPFKGSGVRLLWYVHDFWGFCGTQLLYRTSNARCTGPGALRCGTCVGPASALRLRLFRRRFDAVDVAIPQTRAVATLYEAAGITPRRWSPVDPWIDTETFRRAKDAPRSNTVVYAGPLSRAKGAHLALECFARMRTPGIHLQMIGGETHHGTWAQEQAEKLGIGDRVQWLGRLSAQDLARRMGEARLMLFTSECEEPFGLTWVQALACGTPVVATRTKSLEEIFGPHGDEGRGIVLEDANGPALAAAADAALGTPISEKTAAAISAAVRERFTLSRVDALLRPLYLEGPP